MIIFAGVAGSGKSVQGRMLADYLGYPWLSTGEFLRMLVSGSKRHDMVQGKLLGDDEIIKLIQKIFNLIDTSEEFILDGFPRTVAQADWLINQTKHKQLKVSAVIHLLTNEKFAEKRLLIRGRKDDNQEAIHKRFVEYQESIIPILNELKSNNIKVFDINGEQPIEVVFEEIKNAVSTI